MLQLFNLLQTQFCFSKYNFRLFQHKNVNRFSPKFYKMHYKIIYWVQKWLKFWIRWIREIAEFSAIRRLWPEVNVISSVANPSILTKTLSFLFLIHLLAKPLRDASKSPSFPFRNGVCPLVIFRGFARLLRSLSGWTSDKFTGFRPHSFDGAFPSDTSSIRSVAVISVHNQDLLRKLVLSFLFSARSKELLSIP